MYQTLTLKAFFCFLLYANTAYSGNPIRYKFIENKGQLPANVQFSASVEAGKIYFEKHAIIYDFIDADDAIHPHKHKAHSRKNSTATHTLQRHTYKMYFEGANSTAAINANFPTETRYNYFYGKDERKWVYGAKAYKKILYQNIYKNISAAYYTSAKNTFKYDFILAPGANVDDIQLKYEGVNNIKLENGNLVISTSLNRVTEQKPYAYQVINGQKISIPCKFVLNGNTVSFALPKSYNNLYMLIIDPEIIFSTFSGSVADNFGFSAAYDAQGNIYSGGIAFSKGYPVTLGAYQQNFNGGINDFEQGEYASDIAIMKFSSDGNELLYATYLGGNGNEYPQSMAVNSQNELIILGSTNSDNFPVTSNAYNVSYNNNVDIFICKLSADGSKLIASTYFGGKDADGRNNLLKYNFYDEHKSELQVDAADNIVFVSSTQSADFPVKNAMQQNINGEQDACVVKFNSSLDTLIFSTYLGGSSTEAGYGIAVNNENGNIYVCGGTSSKNFPVSQNSISSVYGGNTDGFIAQFTAHGTYLSSTYISSGKYDQAFKIRCFSGLVYVAGQTLGSYPVTHGVYNNKNSSQFISIITSDLTAINRSTVFGSGRDSIDIVFSAFNVDDCGNIYVAGWGGRTNAVDIGGLGGNTRNLPVTHNAFQQSTDGSDFYIAVFKKDFDTLLYATFYGGNKSEEHTDGGTSMFNNKGTLYLTACGGCGGYSDWPVTANAWSIKNKGLRPNNMGYGCNQAILKMELYPVRDFTYNFTAGNENINFFGPDANTYKWNFGDGNFSTERNPKRKFEVGKTYRVCLITNTDCRNDTICKDVKIWNIGLHENMKNTVNFYPNPAQNGAILKVDKELIAKNFPVTLYMTDALGREVYQIQVTAEKTQINLQNFSNGIYYYTLAAGENIVSQGKLNVTK